MKSREFVPDITYDIWNALSTAYIPEIEWLLVFLGLFRILLSGLPCLSSFIMDSWGSSVGFY